MYGCEVDDKRDRNKDKGTFEKKVWKLICEPNRNTEITESRTKFTKQL